MIWLHVIEYLLLIALLLGGLFINVLTLPGLWLMTAIYGFYAWLSMRKRARSENSTKY